MEEKMYAKCLNNNGASELTIDREYLVNGIKHFDGFGDDCFFVLEDGLAYASCHFSVTYLR